MREGFLNVWVTLTGQRQSSTQKDLGRKECIAFRKDGIKDGHFCCSWIFFIRLVGP